MQGFKDTKFGRARINKNTHWMICSKKEGNHGKYEHRLIVKDNLEELEKIAPNIDWVVHYKDNNGLNNNPSNLRIMPKIQHMLLHNQRKIVTKKSRNRMSKARTGEKHSQAKATEKEVIEIRKLRIQGVKKKVVFEKIGKRLGLSMSGFDNIWYNQKWKHVVVEA